MNTAGASKISFLLSFTKDMKKNTPKKINRHMMPSVAGK
jgi:hypothetical protein